MQRPDLLTENYIENLIKGLADDLQQIKSTQTVGRQSINFQPYLANANISILSSSSLQSYTLEFTPTDKLLGNAWPFMIIPIGNAISTTNTYAEGNIYLYLDYKPSLSTDSQRYTLTVLNNTIFTGAPSPQNFNVSVQFIIFGPHGQLNLVS